LVSLEEIKKNNPSTREMLYWSSVFAKWVWKSALHEYRGSR